MKTQINVDKSQVTEFCLKWRIREFSIFGSAVRDDFRPDGDVDVLVSFAADAQWSLFDIVQMQEELKAIFGREVDLVEKEALRNPFRRRAILSGREVLYAA